MYYIVKDNDGYFIMESEPYDNEVIYTCGILDEAEDMLLEAIEREE